MFITPWVFNTAIPMSTGTAWNFWIVGALIGLLSIAALVNIQVWEEGANLVLGVWTFFSPWIVGFGVNQGLTWNALISGAIVAIISLVALYEVRSYQPGIPVR